MAMIRALVSNGERFHIARFQFSNCSYSRNPGAICPVCGWLARQFAQDGGFEFAIQQIASLYLTVALEIPGDPATLAVGAALTFLDRHIARTKRGG